MGHKEQRGNYNEATALIIIVVPDTVFSLKYINKDPGTWHACTDMENVTFLILINRKLQKQFTYTRQK